MLMKTFWVKTTDGQKLCAKAWGDQNLPALILVHGYPDNQSVWESVIAELIEKFYVISYDVRGAGQSSVPKARSDYRLAQLANDLASVADSVIPQRAYHLAAHDWGSIQMWEAVTEPRFKGKILSYSSISGPCLDHAAHALRRISKQPQQLLQLLKKSWYIGVFHLPLLAPTYWRWSSPKQWSAILNKLERQADLPVSPSIQKDGTFGIQLYRANFIPRLYRPRQRFAQCPVQAIVLKYDHFVSPDYIDEMQNWVTDFHRVEVAANHWAILSQPKVVAAHIAQFIEQISS